VAILKRKGDLAELRVAADILSRGHRIAIPFGEDWDYDLIVCRDGSAMLERVQVKHVASDGEVIPVRCRSMSLTNGRVRAVKKYTSAMVDWIGVYDVTTDRCYYVPSTELGADGRSLLTLRLVPSRSGQRARIRWAADYLSF
jgi:hypothetical protein